MTQLPLGDRSHRFAIGTFAHLTRTRSVAECRDAAEEARTAAASSPDESRRVRNIATTAWWAAVGDRVAAGSTAGVGRAGS
ncbi:MAG: hypothetical protein ACRDOY_09690 [Nocardioidaceae bacterium]